MKYFPHILSLVFLVVPVLALGAEPGEYVHLVNIPIKGDGFGAYINALYLFSISIAAIIAVLKIIIAGVKYMLSDVVTNKGEAKKEILTSLLGLLLIISAVLILEVINPNLKETNVVFDKILPKKVPLKSLGLSSADTPVAGETGQKADEAAATVNETVSGGCDTKQKVVKEDTDYTYYALDTTGCEEGFDRGKYLGTFSKWCIENNGGYKLDADKATCPVPKAGIVNSRYGTVIQNAISFKKNLDEYAGGSLTIKQGQANASCTAKYKLAKMTNVDGVITCSAPTIITYSGNQAQYGAGDCKANHGVLEVNNFSADECVIWP